MNRSGKRWGGQVAPMYQSAANAFELKAKLSGQPVEIPATLLDEYTVLGKYALPTQQERQGRLFR